MGKILILMLFLAFCGCTIRNGATDIPPCVREKIRAISREAAWNPPAKIYSYRCADRLVYFVPAHCCDIPSVLYDENCNRLCFPDGGFTGKGDGRCPDFFDTRTHERLVWEDTRQ